ncbi:uncharacterized protein LOC107305130 isoform X1 [Oryza brachyantha]|uniref:uncharacterized protein LOC107305130 isoform X1 n=1 Tax=Oryza brachyantha TaxID=4533 RepID=UPI001ADB43AB|nr:uncharacterized protein LOC107305130 isoform X1 [Oryza brachyantha]
MPGDDIQYKITHGGKTPYENKYITGFTNCVCKHQNKIHHHGTNQITPPPLSPSNFSLPLPIMHAPATRNCVAAGDPHPTGVPSSVGRVKRWRYNLGSTDDYERLDVVGQGAFGVVVRVQVLQDHGKNIALKRLLGTDDGAHFTPDFDALRVKAACQHACRSHPSIVEIKNIVADGKTARYHRQEGARLTGHPPRHQIGEHPHQRRGPYDLHSKANSNEGFIFIK